MDDRSNRVELLQALAVTAELTGSEFTESAARVMADDLAHYPLQQILGALTRCRRELRGRLTLAAIIERIDDGRPGANEAWAMIPQDEQGSCVWTTEMAQAFGIADPLLREGQVIAARSAFIETYDRLVTLARSEQLPVHWSVSLGHDPTKRAAAIEDAERKGRITSTYAKTLLPAPAVQVHEAVARLAGPKSPLPDNVKAQLLAFTGRARGAK